MREQLYKVLNMYSEPTRLKILVCLDNKKCSVNELQQYVDTSQPNISKHLKILHENNMVTKEKEGKYVYYSVNSEFKECCKLYEQLIELFKSHPDGMDVIDRIKL